MLNPNPYLSPRNYFDCSWSDRSLFETILIGIFLVSTVVFSGGAVLFVTIAFHSSEAHVLLIIVANIMAALSMVYFAKSLQLRRRTYLATGIVFLAVSIASMSIFYQVSPW